MVEYFFKFCLSGEILPNLVTLIMAATWIEATSLSASVTKLGKILKMFGRGWGYFSSWQNFESTLAKIITILQQFQCWKWPNIEKHNLAIWSHCKGCNDYSHKSRIATSFWAPGTRTRQALGFLSHVVGWASWRKLFNCANPSLF